MMEFVSWDDDIPNWMESHKKCNHQPDFSYIYNMVDDIHISN